MSEPISLDAVRAARGQPEADLVRKDGFGRPMFCFLLEYTMGGDEWGHKLWAYSEDDARARVAAMRESLVLRGQIFGTVPS